jgi:hypothetical protein
MTDHGWEHARTGATYPVYLGLQGIDRDIDARLRDIAIRPSLDIYKKVLSDERIKNALALHFGDHYNEMIKQFFADLAGQSGTRTRLQQDISWFFNTVSNNMVSDFIGFNPGTVVKHFPQSLLQSMREVGTEFFSRGARNLYATNQFTEGRNIDFMMNGGMVGNRMWKGSGELQSRREYFKDDLSHATQEALGRLGTLGNFPEYAKYAGSWTLAKTDSIMSKVTWWAKYESELEKRQATIPHGITPAQWNDAIWDAHSEAAALADRSVRTTHGSLAITAKAELFRRQDAMTQSVTRANNFFNNVWNRRFRMMHMTKDLMMGKSERGVLRDLATISGDFVTYAIAPTLFEDFADPICKEDEEWSSCLPKYLLQGVAAPIPIVRDIVHGMITGSEPSVGMIWNGAHAVHRLFKEAAKIPDGDVNWGDAVQNSMTLMGAASGMPGAVPGRWANYGIKVLQGEEEAPSTPEEFGRVIRWGKTTQPKHEEQRETLVHRLITKGIR